MVTRTWHKPQGLVFLEISRLEATVETGTNRAHLQALAVQLISVQYSSVHDSTWQYMAVQYSLVQFSLVQYRAVLCRKGKRIPGQCSSGQDREEEGSVI